LKIKGANRRSCHGPLERKKILSSFQSAKARMRKGFSKGRGDSKVTYKKGEKGNCHFIGRGDPAAGGGGMSVPMKRSAWGGKSPKEKIRAKEIGRCPKQRKRKVCL